MIRPKGEAAAQAGSPLPPDFERHQEACAQLGSRPLQFLLVDVVGRPLEFVEDDRHQAADVFRSGRGMHAEHAGIRKAPVERIDRIAKTAPLAHLLEEARTTFRRR